MTNLVKIERLFKTISCPPVLGAGRVAHGRIIEKLDNLDFSLTNVVVQPSQILTLHMFDSKEFAYYMSGEANRFFLASMISLDRAKNDESENLSWQVVEHYYAAYYAVHYLIRVSGNSLTNIDKAALNIILRSNLTGNTYQGLSSGLNLMCYDQSCEKIVLHKHDRKDKKGGSHADAWELWVSIIEKLLVAANADVEEYAESAVSLSEHLRFIKRSNNTFSPTVIRNEINYQFSNNAWCFDDLTKDKINRVRRAISENNMSLRNNNGDLLASLICNNNFIIFLAKKIFLSASQNNSKSICRSLLNKYKKKIPALI
ncbi:TPA: hypothetical protein MYV51_003295 [Citrobacter amalonaticus]|uniref:hypothetical protein n=1 Tax=Citrobacter amalonaticus TaxID=35703 RepID=UPI00388DB314|nr:hypothetical protein [Citrobacter amalonaticus]